MTEYKAVFRELRYEVWKVAFLNSFLNAAIIFFAGNIVCTLLNQPYWFSVFPAIIAFGISFVSGTKKYSLRRIEEGNPEVAEILRTAHDNSDKDNLVVHALFLELLQKMETVTAGVFINPKKALIKLVIIAGLAFIPLLITSFTPFLIIQEPFANVNLGFIAPKNNQLAPTGAIDDPGVRDIYGNSEVVQLGNQRLDITAASSSGGVDFSQTSAATGNQFKYNDYPVDPTAQQTTAGSGGSASDADLINKYSECARSGTCS